eukprot:SAG11_NODE_1292_length_5285_cov_9.364057_1_plen_57_part_00
MEADGCEGAEPCEAGTTGIGPWTKGGGARVADEPSENAGETVAEPEPEDVARRSLW